MTNHEPEEWETYIQHYGKKKRAFKVKTWKEEYEKREIKNKTSKTRI